MKKTILLCLALVLLSGCAPSAAVDTSGWQNYRNEYYSFQINYPEGYSYCLNAYCINEIPEDALSTFMLLNVEKSAILSVQPYKNALGMTAMEYGEQTAAYNEVAYDEETIDFAGQDAFAFTTEEGFYEPGGTRGITEDGHISLLYDAAATEIPFVGVNAKSRVVYLDYEGYFYRIVYSINEENEAIVGTFEFLE